MRLLPTLAFVLLALCAAPAAAQQPADDPSQPLVYVFSLDGLDGDRVDAGSAPFLASLLAGQEEARATYWQESRSVMVAETNPNHVAMATGAFGDKSGIPGNAFAVYADASKRACGGEEQGSQDPPGAPQGGEDEAGGAAEQTDGERAECLAAETFFAAAKRQSGGRVVTAGIFGKPKLAQIFAGRNVDRDTYDADFLYSPCDPRDPSDFCDRSAPARPNDGYAITDGQIMDVVLRTVETGVDKGGTRRRPNLTFVNFPTIDASGHGFGTQNGAYDAAIGMMDGELRRFVERQKALGLWSRTVVFVVSDHSMDTTLSKMSLRLSLNAAGIPDDEVLIVQNGSVDMIYLADRTRPDRAEFLKRVREAVLRTPGVDEALYREPNPADGGNAHTLAGVHPGWRIAGPRTGDLFVTHVEGGAFNEPNPLTGNHGSSLTSDNIMAVIGGGGQVRQQTLTATPGPRFDDTLVNTGQSQNVDVAPTVMALLGLAPPAQSEGRVLDEAFAPGVLRAPAGGGGPSGGDSGAPCAIASRARATVAPRGRRLRIGLPRGGVADVFRVSSGRRVIGNRRVARVRRAGLVRPRGGDGFFFVRVRARGATERRFALRRRGGRFVRRPAFDRPPSCSLLTSAKLERPVFGGRANRPLRVAFRVARDAQVTVTVSRRGRVVRRFAARRRAGGLTHRLRIGAERLRRGDHVVRITVADEGDRATARLVARRL